MFWSSAFFKKIFNCLIKKAVKSPKISKWKFLGLIDFFPFLWVVKLGFPNKTKTRLKIKLTNNNNQRFLSTRNAVNDILKLTTCPFQHLPNAAYWGLAFGVTIALYIEHHHTSTNSYICNLTQTTKPRYWISYSFQKRKRYGMRLMH